MSVIDVCTPIPYPVHPPSHYYSSPIVNHRAYRTGESLETTVRILPLTPGELILNGFYLLEENKRGSGNRPHVADSIPPSGNLPLHGVLNAPPSRSRCCQCQPILRRFAHALSVMMVVDTTSPSTVTVTVTSS